MPVAPPASATGAVTEQLEPAQQQERDQVADVQAVGGGVEAGVDRDRALVEARPEGLEVGGVVEQAPGLQVVEDVGAAHDRSLSPLTTGSVQPVRARLTGGPGPRGPQ